MKHSSYLSHKLLFYISNHFLIFFYGSSLPSRGSKPDNNVSRRVGVVGIFLGNVAFSFGDFPTDIPHFFEAIDLAPDNHVLYSNRSMREDGICAFNQHSSSLVIGDLNLPQMMNHGGYNTVWSQHLPLDPNMKF
ncbi:unnamed protein product [Vicia faba]|uniref:Uncharacterized protein n=1 Tax=Vicia faba TaxID=3906 RepID=A0AAV0Z5S1_VICFA|nr:unnamed protein product [Vicia faba]